MHYFVPGPLDISMSPDGKHIASLGADYTVRIWDCATGRQLQRFGLPFNEDAVLAAQRHHSGPGIAYSPAGDLLAAIDFANSVNVWDANSAKIVQILKGHQRAVTCLSFSRSGSLLATGDATGTLRVWQPTTGKLVRDCPVADRAAPAAIRCINFSPDETLIAAALHRQPVHMWAPHSGAVKALDDKLVATWLTFVRQGTALFVAARPARAVSSSFVFIDIATGLEYATWPQSSENITASALSPDGSLLAMAKEGGGTIEVFDVSTHNQLCTLSGHEGEVTSLIFTRDNSGIVSASSDSTILLWNLHLALQEGSNSLVRSAEARDWDTRWRDLGNLDAPRAYRAMATLAASPAQAVPFLVDKLGPPHPRSGKTMSELLADLNDDRFSVRESASQILLRNGTHAIPKLRLAQAQTTDPEARRRLDHILRAIADQGPDKELVRTLRIISVLESIGTGPARKVLQMLADRSASPDITGAAQASLERLRSKP